MYTKIKLILISLLSVILISSASFARDLVITFDDMNPGPKAAFENAIAKFQKENPDINVIANNWYGSSPTITNLKLETGSIYAGTI